MSLVPPNLPHHTTRVTQPPDEQAEPLALVAALQREQREVIVACGVLGYDFETAAAISIDRR